MTRGLQTAASQSQEFSLDPAESSAEVFYSINDIGAADLQPIEESILMMSVRKRAVNGGGSHSSLFDRVTG
ncbi:BEACH domain-containing protein B [Clarias magur]|uniref:BEACH domain-containing protein B n=1 Tax=Clarias magur TaxID=1594786 RepID=A0A8J4TQD5_CLAMG|nr:BEACH domain-containing protein B [Clarias magur]